MALNALLAAAWWYLKHGIAFLWLLDGGTMLSLGPGRWLCRNFLFGPALSLEVSALFPEDSGRNLQEQS